MTRIPLRFAGFLLFMKTCQHSWGCKKVVAGIVGGKIKTQMNTNSFMGEFSFVFC